ncbi:hypothetical protein BR93DRAFT_206773 [Coniochaeta sp. PMI_546]|nr:hypothetical protein BR93DRAFT_206773 [Coniochaeta sp. PMI_546]
MTPSFQTRTRSVSDRLCSRCDGRTPCTSCVRRKTNKCVYDKPRQRVVPSKGAIESLSQSFEACRAILRRLYPDHEWQALLPLSRQGLLDLLANAPESSHGNALASPGSQGYPSPLALASVSEDSLCGLEQLPEPETEWDEERHDGNVIPLEADDVNALSLSLSPQTSYLGVSSVKAALKVMLKLQPDLLMPVMSPGTLHRESPSCGSYSAGHWSFKGQLLVNAYFRHVHMLVPVLSEAAFRAEFLEGKRTDDPWMALMNMVLAMGTIAAKKSDDHSHIDYYNKAMEHISIQSLGSSRIETLQALILIGGFYLHYMSRPNMADAVVGAAIRMASAMGLHRELPGCMKDLPTAELRRRIWWSLFCTDIWGTTTLGRPSFGWLHAGIKVGLPQVQINPKQDGAQHAGVFPLVENIKFCKIAAQIQDILAVLPLVRAEDRHSLDSQLRQWHANLPWLLETDESCAEPLYIVRCVMKWRYLNLRMLLHRPALLALAGGPSRFVGGPDDVVAVDNCRNLAAETIEDIGRKWKRNQLSGWHAAWFLYQAAIVPLVSIFWQWGSASVPEWQQQVERVLELLEAMEDWSPVAGRSREAVRRMYDASRRQAAHDRLGHGDNAAEQSAVTACPPTEELLSSYGAFQDMEPMGLLECQTLWDMNGMLWDMPDIDKDSEMYGGLMQYNHWEDGTAFDWPFRGGTL